MLKKAPVQASPVRRPCSSMADSFPETSRTRRSAISSKTNCNARTPPNPVNKQSKTQEKKHTKKDSVKEHELLPFVCVYSFMSSCFLTLTVLKSAGHFKHVQQGGSDELPQRCHWESSAAELPQRSSLAP